MLNTHQPTFESLEQRRLLSAGQLDPNFGSGGVALVDFDWANGYDIVNQRMPDGKLLIGANVGGSFSGGASGTLVLARLNADGSPDTSFGVAGQVNTGVLAFGTDVSVHPTTGKIAITSKSAVANEVNVAVLSADGVPDASFDGDGRRVLTFSRNQRTRMHVGWQGDELILAAAADVAGEEGDAHIVVMRLNADGSTDTGFGTGGQHVIAQDVVAGNDSADGRSIDELHVMADGRIVITSAVRADNGGGIDFTAGDVFRLTAGGDADASYGGGDGSARIFGISAGPDGDEGGEIVDAHVAPDGAVHAIFSRPHLIEGHHYLVRFTPAGERIDPDAPTIDLSLSTLPVGESSGTDLFVDDAGRYYVTGVTAPFGSNSLDWLVARYNADGKKDQSYGSSGQITIDAMLVFVPTPLFDGDGAVTLVGLRGPGVGGVQGEPKRLQVVRVQGGAGSAADVVLNKRGSLIVKTNDAGENVSLSIRKRDGRLVLRVGDFARSFAPSRVKRIALLTSGGDDTITIGPGVKGASVDAGDGADTINGGGGDDVLLGGTGPDQIFGNDGADKLVGGGGNDYLLGGAGKDDLFGQGGSDTLSGAGGNDRLFGGPDSADRILGGAGDDAAAEDDKDSYDAVETLLA